MYILENGSPMRKEGASSHISFQIVGYTVGTSRSEGESEVGLTNGRGSVRLNRVLQVSEIAHSLLSVLSLREADHTVLLTKDKCVVQNENKTVGYDKRD